MSRIIAGELESGQPFTSPKGEQAWVRPYGSDFWVFPNWPVDLTAKTDELKRAGYKMLVHLLEPLPKSETKRSSRALELEDRTPMIIHVDMDAFLRQWSSWTTPRLSLNL
ncbi:MAG: hypothetical protein R2874_13610 [Desulfobacterales bacterium]